LKIQKKQQFELFLVVAFFYFLNSTTTLIKINKMMSTREENILRNAEFLKSLGIENPIPDKTSKKRKRTQKPAIKEGLRKSERSNKLNTNNKISNIAEICEIKLVSSVNSIIETKYQKFAISFKDLETFIPQNVKISKEVRL
jgi:hypothetical protein